MRLSVKLLLAALLLAGALWLSIYATGAEAQQVILTVREQQTLKALMGPSGEIEQLLILETSSHPLSATGHARIMADVSHTLLCSFNGGAYAACLGSGGANPGAPDLSIQYRANATTFGGSQNNTWNTSSLYQTLSETSPSNDWSTGLNALTFETPKLYLNMSADTVAKGGLIINLKRKTVMAGSDNVSGIYIDSFLNTGACGGECSMIHGLETGGGFGLSLYKYARLRPAGYPFVDNGRVVEVQCDSGADCALFQLVNNTLDGGPTNRQAVKILVSATGANNMGLLLYPVAPNSAPDASQKAIIVENASFAQKFAVDWSGNVHIRGNTTFGDLASNNVGLDSSVPSFNPSVDNIGSIGIFGAAWNLIVTRTLSLSPDATHHVNLLAASGSATYAITLPNALPGSTQCMQMDSAGNVGFSGSQCGNGAGAGVTSINTSAVGGVTIQGTAIQVTVGTAGSVLTLSLPNPINVSAAGVSGGTAPQIPFWNSATTFGGVPEFQWIDGSKNLRVVGTYLALGVTSTPGQVLTRSSRGTVSAPTASQTDDPLGAYSGSGYGATGYSGGRASINYAAAENWTDAAQGAYLTLATTPIGSTTQTARMRILANGSVGIGTTAPAFDNNSSVFLTLLNATAHAFAELGVGGNASTVGDAVGSLAFFNSSLGTAEKRVAVITSITEGATNGGRLTFLTANAGTLGERMRIDHLGNVGIGTTSPGSLLELSSSATGGNTPTLNLFNTNGTTSGTFGPSISIFNNVAGKHGYVISQMNNPTSNFTIANAASPFTQYVTVSQAGNVGIGTDSPAVQLQVHGTAGSFHGMTVSDATTGISLLHGFQFGIGSNDQAFVIMRENQPINFMTNNTIQMVIAANGNVGVGTSSPGALLDIAGQIRIQGGSPGAGKVLTSDGSGLGSWANAPTGSGAANQLAYWTGTTTQAGNAAFTVDTTNTGLILTKTETAPSVSSIALLRQSLTLSGDRTGIGPYPILSPIGTFNTYIPAAYISISDSTTTTSTIGANDGAPLLGVVVELTANNGASGSSNALTGIARLNNPPSGVVGNGSESSGLLGVGIQSTNFVTDRQTSRALYAANSLMIRNGSGEGWSFFAETNNSNAGNARVRGIESYSSGSQIAGDAFLVSKASGTAGWTNAFVLYADVTNTSGTYGAVLYKLTADGTISTTNTINYATGGSAVATFNPSVPEFIPSSDNTGRVGSATNRWNLVRAVTVTSGDQCFENGWCFTEADRVGEGEGLALRRPDGSIAHVFK